MWAMTEPIPSAPRIRVRVIAERVRCTAEAQEGVISRAQLEACGLSGGEISRWLGQGRLIRILPGVYALGHTRLSWRGRLWAALLYAGPGAALSHRTAAHLWQLISREDDLVHVSNSNQRKSIGYVVTHRPRVLDVAEHDGLTLTTPTRTLIDIAPGCPATVLRKVLARADFRGLLDPDSLKSAMGKGVKGSAALRDAIETHMPELARTLSPLEDKLLFLCDRNNLPLPEPNVWVEGFLVDALWRRQRVVVEVDGRSNHSSASQRRRDRDRDERLRAAAYIVLRYTWSHVTHKPSQVAAEIRAALGTGSE